MKVFFFLCNQQTQLKSRLLFAMTGSLEAKRPHADFSTEMWVWYQEGSHLYKQRWSFCFQFRKVPKQFFFLLAILMKMSPWNVQFHDLYHWIYQIELDFIFFMIFKDSSVRKTLHQTASTIICNWSGQVFAAVTFTAAETGLKFTRIWVNL